MSDAKCFKWSIGRSTHCHRIWQHLQLVIWCKDSTVQIRWRFNWASSGPLEFYQNILAWMLRCILHFYASSVDVSHFSFLMKLIPENLARRLECRVKVQAERKMREREKKEKRGRERERREVGSVRGSEEGRERGREQGRERGRDRQTIVHILMTYCIDSVVCSVVCFLMFAEWSTKWFTVN